MKQQQDPRVDTAGERLRERARLERSERRLRQAQSLARLGNWEWDLVTGRTSWSEEIADILGVSREAPADSYETFLERVHPDDRRMLQEIVQDTLKKGTTVPVDFRILRPDGGLRWVHANSEAEFDAEGRPVRLTGFAQDITSRKATEEQLAETERRFLQIAEAIQDVFYLSDARTNRIIYANPAFETVWGVPAAAVMRRPRSWLDRVHPQDRERIEHSLERWKPTDAADWSEEFRIVRPDGAVRWVWTRSSPIRDEDGAIVRYAGMERDITERRQAEDTVRSLLRITWELNSTLDVDALLEELVKETLHLVGAESGCAGLKTDAGMTSSTFFHRGTAVAFAHRWEAGRGLPGRVLKGPAACIGAAGDAVEPLLRERFGVRTAICAPLVDAHWSPIGFFMLCDRHDRQPFGREDEEKLLAVAQAASVAVQNALAYRRLQEATAALRVAEAKYRDIFENALEGIGQSNPDGSVRAANPALARLLGYDSPEQLIASIDDIGAQIYVDKARQVEGRRILAERGAMTGFEAELRRRDGTTIWVSMNIRVVRDEDGRVAYFEGSLQDISQRRRAEDLLREVSGRLLRMQSDERRRIARELHDSTAQSLAALAMNLGLLSRSAGRMAPTSRRRLDDSLNLAQQCCQEIRTLSYLLHPPALDEADLWSAVRFYAEGFANRSGIQVAVSMPRRLGRLPAEIETTLFRIVQESLANIHRHSGSRTARISIARRAKRVTLTVLDDGHGMPGMAVPSGDRAGEHAALGVGIAGMRERVRQLGGRFAIDTTARGTKVSVEIPLSPGH